MAREEPGSVLSCVGRGSGGGSGVGPSPASTDLQHPASPEMGHWGQMLVTKMAGQGRREGDGPRPGWDVSTQVGWGGPWLCTGLADRSSGHNQTQKMLQSQGGSQQGFLHSPG